MQLYVLFCKTAKKAFGKGVKHIQKTKNLRRTVNIWLKIKTILVSKKPSDDEIHNGFKISKKTTFFC